MSPQSNYVEEPWRNSGSPLQLNWFLPSGAGFGDLHSFYGAELSTGFDIAFATAGSFPLYTTVTRASGTAHAEPQKRSGPEAAAFIEQRERLISAINSMRTSAPNWAGREARISNGAASTAEKFLRCLTERHVLPKVAADGEGDVMLVWGDDTNIICIVTVEPKLLHLIGKPGTRGAQRIDAQRFLGVQIPPTVLRQIPVR